MTIVPLGLSVLGIAGWLVWVLLAVAATVMGVVVVTRIRSRGLWGFARTALEGDWGMVLWPPFCWCFLLLFLIADWSKLHLLWIGPGSGAYCQCLGKILERLFLPLPIGYELGRSAEAKAEKAFRRIVERVWRAHLTEGPYTYREFFEEAKRACADEGIPFDHLRLSKSRELNREEVESLLKTCSAGPEGLRDWTIIFLLYGYGLARSELISLTMNDYNPENETLVVESPGVWMKTLRKVDIRRLEQSRPLIISTETLLDWIQVRGHDPGPFFCQIGKDGTLYPSRPITATKVCHLLKTRGEQAGIHPFKATSFPTIGTTTSWTEAFTTRKGAVPPLALKCPSCGSIAPPSEVWCDWCGYYFRSKPQQFAWQSTWLGSFRWF